VMSPNSGTLPSGCARYPEIAAPLIAPKKFPADSQENAKHIRRELRVCLITYLALLKARLLSRP
jgi:hypothetical protein